jgi:Holliday junction resolvase-like predicted endonuclease
MEAQAREPQMGLNFEKVRAALMESREDFDRRMRESQRETERLLRETARVVADTSKSVRDQCGSFGEMHEYLVVPHIEEKFEALGYHFISSAKNVKIKNEQGQIIAEIDILLENIDYSVAVEVKSKPKKADIDVFKRQLGVLRKRKDKLHDPRKIHGAIAGAIFMDSVKKAVLKAGFYVIEQSGDTLKINVPEGFKPQEW